ncbi:ribosomal RNA-processing protein 8 [Plakobranchus ocellatus]|uniref:Ribosomal RNA-processing protein 8 n=1 Tax=Plakobranchus ocellatus TaxID=259542 RepID=A0AAV3Z0I5_9GAST|nr:ribosomal RNA-processing protein 8 [Plakobranchus ocellatus]
MSEFDCDEGWDVSQEAESLNKSLFGLKSKKKRKQKASKDENEASVNVFSSKLLEDSDDETFTKKGIRKLKERRRKQKKRNDKSGEINSKEESSALSSSIEHKHEAKKDSTLSLNKSDASLQRNQKRLKIGDKKESGVKGAEKKKPNKRKRASSAEEADDLSITPKKKKIEVDKVAAVSNVQSELEATGKKTKRKRKKRSNSKKNKYAHLALNRKENGTSESGNHEKSDAMSSPGNAESNQQVRKLKTDEKQLFERKKVIQPPKDLSEKDKSGKKRTIDMHHSPSKSLKNAKLRTATADSSVLDYTDMKNISKVGLNNKHKPSSDTENEIADAVDFSTKKNRKRKKDSSAATEIKLLKVEKTFGKQNLTNMDSSHNKLKKKNKAVEENVKLQKGKKSSNVKTSSALGATNKICESVDPSKMLELQQKQKKLLRLLTIHGNGDKGSESTTSKTTKVQEKKRNKKNKLEMPCTTIQSQKPNSSIKNVKKKLENVSRIKQEESADTSKVPAVSKQQHDNSTSTSTSSIWGAKATAIGSQAQEKLNAARFRYLNEQLYTCQGSDALQLFKEDREAFNVYHTGFENQASKWPVNPVNVIIKQIKDKSSNLVVADFGCGDAKLAQALPQKVHSFDLVALNPRVKACDMSSVPLQNESVDIAVFCLSLMGTNLDDYIHEANRVLKTGGLLKIVEVVSRFRGLSSFLAAVCSHGFQLLNRRDLSQMFYLMDFKKVKTVKKAATVKGLSLKPCVYKKR